jgi:hypothetical protein
LKWGLKSLFEKSGQIIFGFFFVQQKILVTRKKAWPGCGSKDTKPAKEGFLAFVDVSAKAYRFTNKNST